MKRSIFAAVVASTLLSVSAYAETLSISCGAVGQELELCQQGVAAWEQETGHTVKIITTPNSTTERLALYQQLLAAGADDIDVFQIDVIWPGILGNHFIDLKPYSNGEESSHFPSIVSNNTVKDRLVAMPWFTDAGVLYYRSDLLEKYEEKAPETWEALTATAEKIMKAEREAGNDKMWGFVWQGRAYEGLTCDALEWVASYNGGTIVDGDGKITINNDNAKQALTTAAGWVDTISPPGVLNYGEEEARGVFQTGNAVFMRNWPYAWSLGNSEDSPIKGKIGVVALPKGGEDGSHSGTLGGWQLAVSKYSKNPELAASLVMYLTSLEEQKRRAIVGSYNPTIESLYSDEEVLTAVPFFGSLYDTFANGTPRPSTATGAKYNQVSNAFWNATHSVLSGSQNADVALAKLQKDLKRISRGGRW
ncbi:ABC transporter substrate-binding protein [Enterovibrio norvegicus FF-162]|uniref:ABC transporter substrate-binding protein n=1 Tax=Enterovibrio norvegicus TaxID=188144 RepID=UPI0002F7500B|nr:ABC transporter substrate-binding protein [Enterovibrio norvegicus]OEE90480.1 ABC transporter substrate-binding protein [Enterovibrio norvegicus FF-162]